MVAPLTRRCATTMRMYIVYNSIFYMEKVPSKSDWCPIVTVPSDIDLELCVYDNGEYHGLAFPCRRNGAGWSDVRRNKMVPIRPTHWKPWVRERT